MRRQIEGFDFGARPGRFTQELEAGGHGGVTVEAANIDAETQFGPPIMVNQTIDNLLQRDAVKGIVDLRITH